MPGPTPSLAEVDAWFDKTILPARTAWSGLSPSRLYKTPHRLVAGNQTDPNGLCGDTSSYVADEFNKAFRDLWTTDGYQIGMVLWEGLVANHIANVMLPRAKAVKQSFYYQGGVLIRPVVKASLLGSPTYAASTLTEAELLALHVYDLYYKKRTTLGPWWEDLDRKGGTVTVGLEHDFT